MRIEKDGNIKNSNFKVQQFNNNVDKRSFVIDRLYFGNYETGDDETKNLYENDPIDLVDCNVSILLTNPDDKINEGANLYITNLNGDTPTTKDDKISINWLLDRNITNYSGKRSFQLVFSKNNGDIVLRTKVMSFNVLSSLDTEENIIEVAPSLIQEWENKLNTVLNQSNDFNTYADTKINEKIENKMYFYKESMQEITTSIENENNFPITMQNYNKDNCITQINVNGIRNTAYTINELNEVVFNTPIKVIGTKIQIFILKAIVSDSVDLNTLKGDKGDKGEGIPTGGTTGQVLSKKSNTNYDYEWTNNEATVEVIDNLTSTDTTKPLSANMGRVLGEKHNWKLHTTVTGREKATLPTEYNELYIEIYKYDSTDPVISIYVPKESLTSNNKTFRTGYYFNSSVHGAVASVITLTTYYMSDLYLSGSAYSSNVISRIYYR